MQMCTTVFVWKYFCVGRRISNSDWYWEWLAAHMVLLSMFESILFIWIVIWSPLLLSNICMCFNNISLFPPLLDVYGMLFLWSYMYRWYIKCSNIALIPLFNDLSRVILEWIKVHVYWIESSTCLFVNIDHQALHFKKIQ